MKKTPAPVFPKLVRDLIPLQIAKKGETPHIRVAANSDEVCDLLQRKLKEEVAELLSAEGRKHILEELADITEVVFAVARHHGISLEDLEEARENKKRSRGRFDAMIILESVSEK